MAHHFDLALGDAGRISRNQAWGAGDPYGYEVLGMPPGEEADIVRCDDGRWQARRFANRMLLRVRDECEHATPEDALAALQREINDAM